MNVDTQDWVCSAEDDFRSAGLLLKHGGRKAPVNVVCFHGQQCVEKYLKGRLEEARMTVPKIHNLVLLLEAVLPHEPLWESFRTSLAGLNNYAVHFRYPGHAATRADALEALKICRSFRKDARLALGLPPR